MVLFAAPPHLTVFPPFAVPGEVVGKGALGLVGSCCQMSGAALVLGVSDLRVVGLCGKEVGGGWIGEGTLQPCWSVAGDGAARGQ